MGTVIAIVVAVLIASALGWLWWRYSLRRRLDEASHDHGANPEMARVRREIQDQIDRGKAAGQGFLF